MKLDDVLQERDFILTEIVGLAPVQEAVIDWKTDKCPRAGMLTFANKH